MQLSGTSQQEQEQEEEEEEEEEAIIIRQRSELVTDLFGNILC